MKSKIIFENQDREAVESAQNLGMPEPKPKEWIGEFYYDIEYIHAAYLNPEGCMVIFIPSGSWILEYDKDVWNRIVEYLDNSQK